MMEIQGKKIVRRGQTFKVRVTLLIDSARQ